LPPQHIARGGQHVPLQQARPFVQHELPQQYVSSWQQERPQQVCELGQQWSSLQQRSEEFRQSTLPQQV
jgi:hypothetical protein